MSLKDDIIDAIVKVGLDVVATARHCDLSEADATDELRRLAELAAHRILNDHLIGVVRQATKSPADSLTPMRREIAEAVLRSDFSRRPPMPLEVPPVPPGWEHPSNEDIGRELANSAHDMRELASSRERNLELGRRALVLCALRPVEIDIEELEKELASMAMNLMPMGAAEIVSWLAARCVYTSEV